MNIKKKLIRNVVLLCLFSFSCFYFSGLYFSLEHCVNNTLKGLYETKADILFQEDYKVFTFSDKSLTLYSLNIEKVGLFYKSTGYSSFSFDKNEENFDTCTYWLNGDDNIHIIAYRFNKKVEYINIYNNNELLGVLTDWDTHQLALAEIESSDNDRHKCIAYDKNHQIIEEKLLFGEE